MSSLQDGTCLTFQPSPSTQVEPESELGRKNRSIFLPLRSLTYQSRFSYSDECARLRWDVGDGNGLDEPK